MDNKPTKGGRQPKYSIVSYLVILFAVVIALVLLSYAVQRSRQSSDLDTFRSEHLTRLDQLEIQTDTLETQAEELTSRLDMLTERTEALETQVSALEDRVDALELQVEALESRDAEQQRQIDTLMENDGNIGE